MLKNLLPFLLLIAPVPAALRPGNDLFHVNGGKSLLDAHNCYPYDGQFKPDKPRALDRISGRHRAGYRPIPGIRNREVIAKVTHRCDGGCRRTYPATAFL